MRLSPISLAASPSVAVPPEPRRPLDPSPKHLRVALSSSAHVWATPAAIARTVRPAPSDTAARASPSSLGWLPRFSRSPLPSRPLAPLPQHFVVALSSTAQVWLAPAAREAAERPTPNGTATKLAPISPASLPMSASDPVPKRPVAPVPQHTTSFVSRITQVCDAPAEIAFALRPLPKSTLGRFAPISLGSSPRESSLPLPSRPLLPAPQHFTAPLDNIAHVWASPAAIATTRTPAARPSDTAVSESPISRAASPRASVSPRPSWPSSFNPQHFTLPSSSSAHVCAAPVASALAVRPVPSATAFNESPIVAALRPRSLVAPLPSRPLSPSPKHFTFPSSSSAHVWELPVDTARTLRPVPRFTATSASPISAAASPSATVPPEPIWPELFEPKHLSAELSSTTQVCPSPAST